MAKRIGLVVTIGLVGILVLACGDDGGNGANENNEPDPDAGMDARDSGGEDSGSDDAGTEDEPDAPLDSPLELGAAGSYNVGITTRTVEYTPDGATEARSLRTVIWYPTTDTDGTAGVYGTRIREEVLNNPSVAIDGPAPVFVFSHGNNTFAEQSYSICERLATHGWLVVAMDHTGNTLAEPAFNPLPYFDLRPQDVSATLDLIYGLPAGDKLTGLFSDDLVAAGHSFGAYDVLALAGATFDIAFLLEDCQQAPPGTCELVMELQPRLEVGYYDERIDLVVPMAATGYRNFRQGLAEANTPVLLMTSVGDETVPDDVEGDPIWAALNHPGDVRISFDEGGHTTFSDLCTIMPERDGNGCGEGFITEAEAHPIIVAYIRAMADRTFSGTTIWDGFLAGEDAPSGVVVSTH